MTGIDRMRKKIVPGQRFSNLEPHPVNLEGRDTQQRGEGRVSHASHEDSYFPSIPLTKFFCIVFS